MTEIVYLMLRIGRRIDDGDGGITLLRPSRDEVDLDRLSPRARQLAQAIADSIDAQAHTILVEADGLDGEPVREDWSAWDKYHPQGTGGSGGQDPHTWLERQAKKLPARAAVVGPGRYSRGRPVEPYLTADQVCTKLKLTGTPVSRSTWHAYVARGQAPAPSTRVGRTPLWDPDGIDAWIAARPGRGARTDLPPTDTRDD